MKAAYLGPSASFSHQAALEIFPASTTTEVVPLPTFADIFDGVQSSTYNYGVVPFENSSNGSVVQLLDLFADRESKYGDVKVCGEHYLAVKHWLFVKPPPHSSSSSSSSSGQPEPGGGQRRGSRSVSESLLKSIKKFYTHPQVWGQCSTFLSRPECRPIARQDVSSTSEAARAVAESEAGTCAAIASEFAGREYGLVALVGDSIEDKGDNTTRFFVLSRGAVDVPLRIPEENENGTGRCKNLVSFTIDHEAPGVLADALSIFKKHGFNLTSINTRPSRVRPWHYIFFAECEQFGQRHREDAIQGLMLNLDEVALNCRHLGSWKDRLRLVRCIGDIVLAGKKIM